MGCRCPPLLELQIALLTPPRLSELLLERSDFGPQLSVLFQILDLVIVIIAVLDFENVDQVPQGVDLLLQGYPRDHLAAQLGSEIVSAFQLFYIDLELASGLRKVIMFLRSSAHDSSRRNFRS